MNPLISPLSILRKRNKAYYLFILAFFFVIFINSFFAGQSLYKTDKSKAEGIIQQVREMQKLKFIQEKLKERNFVLTISLIFLNNFLIDAFTLYSGILFILPVLVPIANLALLGLVLGIESLMPLSFTPLRALLLFIVAFLEFFAMILITYDGLRIGLSWVNPKLMKKKKRKDALKQSLSEGSKILVLVAIILVIASVVETIGIAFLQNMF